MEFNVFAVENSKIVLKAVLQFKSLVWEERYVEAGTMQAVFPKNADTLAEVKIGRFGLIHGTNRMMYIYGIKLTDTELWAYGAECKWLLLKQPWVMLDDGAPTGDVDLKEMIEYVIDNQVSYSYFYTDSITCPDLGSKNLNSLEFDNVYDFMCGVCKLVSAGWYVWYDDYNQKLKITVHVGSDLHETQHFSTVLGNAWGVTYTRNDQNYVNVVYCIGVDAITDPEDPEIVMKTASRMSLGDELMAATLDVREEYPMTEEMTRQEYEDALQTKANMSLIARHSSEEIKVNNYDTARLGTDFSIGDIVTVQIPDYGLSAQMRIKGVTHKIEGNIDKPELSMSNPSITE